MSKSAKPPAADVGAFSAGEVLVDAPAAEILHRHSRPLADFYQRFLAGYREAPPKLIEAIEYSLLGGGKRLRPALVMECWKACGGPESSRRSAMAAGAAIELIHTFSLVHDDLPAMDNDDLRRGRPTCHKVFGDAIAVLAGDAMTTMAFEVIMASAEEAKAGALVRELATAAGPHGMVGGQVMDLEGETRRLPLDELNRLHACKTASLIAASCRMGGISAGASATRLEALGNFGRHLGLSFQIVDDVLDVTSSAEQLGKTPGKDVAHHKSTYPALMGLEASRQEACKHLQAAIDSLADFGEAAGDLRILGRFVVERNM